MNMKSILTLNPELAKNIWLEFSTQRLILMPVVIGLVILSIITNSESTGDALSTAHNLSIIGFIFITILGGIRAAARSLSSELSNETWDWQRMSGIGAWKLASGKLFGGTSYNWYGGLICLAVFTSTLPFTPDPAMELMDAVIMVLVAILAHGITMLITVPFMHQYSGRSKLRTFIVYTLLLTVAGLVISAYASRKEQVIPIPWYGIECSVQGVVLLASAFYCAWVVGGLYRTMRSELLYTDPPSWWLFFLLTNLLFLYGFFVTAENLTPTESVLAIMFVGAGQYIGLTYIMALGDNKNIVGWRKMLGEKDSDSLFRQLPLWTVSLAVSVTCALLFTIIFLVLPPTGEAMDQVYRLTNGHPMQILSFLLALFGFVFRDLGILLLLQFSDRRRAPATMLVFFLILYGLLPGIVRPYGMGVVVYPMPDADPLLTIAFPVAEALVVFMLVRKKWKESLIATNT